MTGVRSRAAAVQQALEREAKRASAVAEAVESRTDATPSPSPKGEGEGAGIGAGAPVSTTKPVGSLANRLKAGEAIFKLQSVNSSDVRGLLPCPREKLTSSAAAVWLVIVRITLAWRVVFTPFIFAPHPGDCRSGG